MTDYIAWLLEEEQAQEEETGAALSDLLESRTGLPGGVGRSTRDQEKDLPLPDKACRPDEARRQSEEEREQALGPEALGRGMTGVTARLAGRAGAGREATALPRLAGERMKGSFGTGLDGEPDSLRAALALYQQVRKSGWQADAVTDYAGRSPAASEMRRDSLPIPEVGPEALDRCFQRDARRYDGGFALL